MSRRTGPKLRTQYTLTAVGLAVMALFFAIQPWWQDDYNPEWIATLACVCSFFVMCAAWNAWAAWQCSPDERMDLPAELPARERAPHFRQMFWMSIAAFSVLWVMSAVTFYQVENSGRSAQVWAPLAFACHYLGAKLTLAGFAAFGALVSYGLWWHWQKAERELRTGRRR